MMAEKAHTGVAAMDAMDDEAMRWTMLWGDAMERCVDER